MRSHILVGAAAGLLALCGAAATASAIELKVSIPTPPTSTRNVIAENFANEAKRLTKGGVTVAVFPSGQLYDDNGVPNALASGALDMGVPNVAHLARIEPNADILSLPLSIGMTAAEVYTLFDGPIGQEIADRIGTKLRSVVIGGINSPGGAAIFTTKAEVKSHADLAGLNLRVPGSAAILGVTGAHGIKPVSISTNEMMIALAQGRVSGLLTTKQAAVSLRLWEAGVKYAWDDGSSWSAYVPVISNPAWNRLGKDQQAALRAAWANTVPEARRLMLDDDTKATKAMEKAGVVFHYPGKDKLPAVREKLMQAQDAIIKKAGMDPDFVARAMAEIAKIRGRS